MPRVVFWAAAGFSGFFQPNIMGTASSGGAADYAPALAAAQAACGAQQWPAGTLYVVATPIGNLADVTLRALHLLALADAVACEDTRHSRQMLRAWGIEPPRLLAVHEHNEAEAAAQVLALLAGGARVAYVSDAGTPAVSDPGARLAAACRAAGHRVVPLPGASSVTCALSAAGLAGDGRFVFAGFLPTHARERAAAVQQLAAEPRAVVLFEAPHRMAALAGALAALGSRTVTVCRELTKQFEHIATMPADALAGWLAEDAQRLRGEFALVLHADARPTAERSVQEGERTLRLLLAEGIPVATAARLAARISGGSRSALYAAALRWRDGEEDGADVSRET